MSQNKQVNKRKYIRQSIQLHIASDADKFPSGHTFINIFFQFESPIRLKNHFLSYGADEHKSIYFR